MKNLMKVIGVKESQKSYPTGNKSFSVMQAFPAGFSSEESDPFLMCDLFGPIQSRGVSPDPDEFPVGWHPHRGMDILTYMISGVGRHGDSMGNRGTYKTPGMQWISVGSGIEHAEGGGSPEGMTELGFQIWLNVPAKYKMDDPRYGTEPTENIPIIPNPNYPDSFGRLLAGKVDNLTGPFITVQPVQIVDYVLKPNSSLSHSLPIDLDNSLVFVYEGSGLLNGVEIKKNQVARLNAEDVNVRDINISSSNEGISVMMFSGKRIKEEIAWHGPFVMNTWEEIDQAMKEYRNGTFLKKKVNWNYKKIASRKDLV